MVIELIALFCLNCAESSFEKKLFERCTYADAIYKDFQERMSSLKDHSKEGEQKVSDFACLNGCLIATFVDVEKKVLWEYPNFDYLLKYTTTLEVLFRDKNTDKYQALMKKMIEPIIGNPGSCVLYLNATKDFSEEFDSFVNNGTPLKEMRLRMLTFIYLIGKGLPHVLNGMEKEFFELLQNEHLEYVEILQKEFAHST